MSGPVDRAEACRANSARYRMDWRWSFPRRRSAASAPPADSRCRWRTAPACNAAGIAGRRRRSDRRRPQAPELQSLFTSFRASVPQLYANIDRVKAKEQNVAVTDIFNTLQVYLGGLYINDFNYLGRTYRVMAQADAPFRATRHGCRAVENPQRRRADGAPRRGDGSEGHHRPRSHQPLQPLPLRRDQRRRRARHQQRAGHRR